MNYINKMQNLEQDLEQDLENPARKLQDLENPARKLQDLENPARKFSEHDEVNIVNNDDNDELLNLAIKESLEQDLENPARKFSEQDEQQLRQAIEASLIEKQDLENPARKFSEQDEQQLRKAIEASLIVNQSHNDELFNIAMYESLDTLDNNEDKDDTDAIILEKAIEESHLSNISIRLNTEIINSGMSRTIDSITDITSITDTEEFENMQSYNDNDNDNYDDDDEEEYIKMIIQQIKENEELENKMKINKITKSIIKEQDFEYEEALRQDIEKEKVKEQNKHIEIPSQIPKEISSKKINDEPEILEIPKTKDELRMLRLAFFDKK